MFNVISSFQVSESKLSNFSIALHRRRGSFFYRLFLGKQVLRYIR